VGCRSAGHVNAEIMIRININVDLSQFKGFVEVGIFAGGELHT